jgi:hypothetical protein
MSEGDNWFFAFAEIALVLVLALGFALRELLILKRLRRAREAEEQSDKSSRA